MYVQSIREFLNQPIHDIPVSVVDGFVEKALAIFVLGGR